MKLGDTIFIVSGQHEGNQTKILNVLDKKVIVRINNIDVAILNKDFVKIESEKLRALL